MKVIFCAILAGISGVSAAFAVPVAEKLYGTSIEHYSNMRFIKDEREIAGLEVFLIPYNPQYGTLKWKILWRAGSAKLDEPLLLDTVVEGNNIKVTVPQNVAENGNWVLMRHGNMLSAERSEKTYYELQKIEDSK